MVLEKVVIELLFIILIDATVIPEKYDRNLHINNSDSNTIYEDDRLSDIFNGVYTDCFLYLSYSCLQKKTLIYLKELNKLREVSVIGDYVKFVKLNKTDADAQTKEDATEENNSETLSVLIDQAVDKFFDNHIIKFNALGRNITVPNSVEGFVGRKKRKGGGGMGHGGGHDDGGKKKMMMMAMMCMKMKLMMMVPAMMGMMGMMSFKGMMFSMMSFMISKMMLLMKILEKKGIGGGSSGGGDGGWAAGGGGGGAWMPAGGQDYGGGGGYDANGQWQSRSNINNVKEKLENEPIISYIVPSVRYNNVKDNDITSGKIKSRKRRGIVDAIQNVYYYWINQILGAGNRRKSNNQRYRIVNGVKYVYYPNKIAQKLKMLQVNNNLSTTKNVDEFKPIIIAEDFNKGETVEGGIQSRMSTKKFHKMKDTVNDTFDENPWK